MTAASPQVRAAHLQLLLAHLEATAAGGGPVALEIPAGLRRAVRDAHRLSWLSAEYLVEICRGAEACVGRDGLESWGAGVLKRLLQAPLFRAFYEAACWFERGSPSAMIGYSVQAWPLLYQDCGQVFVEARGEDFVRLVHHPVPPMLRGETTLLPLLGAIGALPRECGKEARVQAEWGLDRERFVYTARW